MSDDREAAPLKHNRDAVLAIQGGGVYGLTLLGQAQAVIEKHRYNVLAIAGTSAGAVLATLLWAGYSPTEIRKEIVRIAQSEDGGLVSFLGPFAPGDMTLADLMSLKSDVNDVLRTVSERGKVGPGSTWKLYKLAKRILPHFRNRGFFAGDALEQHIERLLRSAPGVPADLAPSEEPLRFRHFDDIAKRMGERAYRPPLLLTATNLTKGKLEVISSVHPRYANIPIAKAVRASAGFPVVFRPRDLPESYEGGSFIDGGVVSNFPVWTFSDAFRQQLLSLPLYRELASLPWIRIGLRVVNDRSKARDIAPPAQFFGALLSMMTGTARNELEDILSARAARTITLKQPVSETGLDDFLALQNLTGDRISEAIDRGFNHADEHLRRMNSPGVFSDTVTARDVEDDLDALIARCLQIVGVPPEVAKLRANIFIPIEARMRMVFSANMKTDEDGDRGIEFRDLHSGLTGFCYTLRRPQICNLAEIAKVRRFGGEEQRDLFGMAPELQDKVRTDRSWLASIPIFDPYEVTLSPALQRRPGEPRHRGKAYRGLETFMDGPVLGVLNLDAGWDYTAVGLDPDPDLHASDDRIQAIIGLMQATAASVAQSMIALFPNQGEPNV